MAADGNDTGSGLSAILKTMRGGGGDIGFGHDNAAARRQDTLRLGEKAQGKRDVVKDILHDNVVDGRCFKWDCHGINGKVAVLRGDDIGGDQAALVGMGLVEEFLEVAGAAANFENRAEVLNGKVGAMEIRDHFFEVTAIDVTEERPFLPDVRSDVQNVGFTLIPGGNGCGGHGGSTSFEVEVDAFIFPFFDDEVEVVDGGPKAVGEVHEPVVKMRVIDEFSGGAVAVGDVISGFLDGVEGDDELIGDADDLGLRGCQCI